MPRERGGEFPPEVTNEYGDLDICAFKGCDHTKNGKYETGIYRHNFHFMEDVLADNKTQVRDVYIQEKLMDFSVNLVAQIHEQPTSFKFTVKASNMMTAYLEAYSFWMNAVAHMDTSSHMRMGLHIASAGNHINDDADSAIHYGDHMNCSVQFSQPMLITISDPKAVQVEHAGGFTKTKEVQDSLANEFAKYLKEIGETNGEEE